MTHLRRQQIHLSDVDAAVFGELEELRSVDPLEQIHHPRNDKELPEDGAMEDGEDPEDDEHGVGPIEELNTSNEVELVKWVCHHLRQNVCSRYIYISAITRCFSFVF